MVPPISDLTVPAGWTFGIITGGTEAERLATVIASIAAQGIPDYEIIVMGHPEDARAGNVRHCRFDDGPGAPGQPHFPISIKKNRIVALAGKPNLCLLHDYVALDQGWFAAFQAFEAVHPDWQIVVCRTENLDGTRYLDWFAAAHPAIFFDLARFPPRSNPIKLGWLPGHAAAPGFQYVPGYAWVARRAVMLAHPLDERLMWNQREDIEWSGRVRHACPFLYNDASVFRFLKQKPGSHPDEPLYPVLAANTRRLRWLAERGLLDHPGWSWLARGLDALRRAYAWCRRKPYHRSFMP